MLQFSRIKKMCCFKRAKFCIIQGKVKRRFILLKQIFNALVVNFDLRVHNALHV